MEEKIKTDGDCFREYIASLDMPTRRVIKKRILNECHIEYPTLDNWRYNLCNIHPLAKEKIEEIAGYDIFVHPY